MKRNFLFDYPWFIGKRFMHYAPGCCHMSPSGCFSVVVRVPWQSPVAYLLAYRPDVKGD